MRYIPLTKKDQKEMLEAIGETSMDTLFSDIPSEVRRGPMDQLPSAKSESQLRSFFYEKSCQNINPHQWKSFAGAGCYDHYIPSVVNALASRGEFLTAYTPYQAEISQGTLQAIFEFQSLIANLFQMEVANASMYDGASSCAEAVLMSLRVNRGKNIYLSSALHPDYKKAVYAYLSDYKVNIHELPVDQNGNTVIENIAEQTSCIVLGQPNFYGVIESLEKAQKVIHQHDALFVVATQEALSFGLLHGPGAYDADIVVGEGQSLGIEMNFGGPHVGLFATRKKLVRLMPGRLVGKTQDENGDPGYVLTLATREQHIRREKATSNICTNHSLCALKACIYMACMGEKGIKTIAHTNYQRAHQLYQKLIDIEGVTAVYQGDFFHEFVLRLPIEADLLIDRLQSKKIIPGVAMSRFDPQRKDEILINVTETKTTQDVDLLADAIKEAL